jgi:hypothetical protein
MEPKTSARKRSGSPDPCCRSGKCQSCVENIRWDRVFQQNFADPYYYSRRPVIWPVKPLATSTKQFWQ